MDMSENIGDLATALAKAQATIAGASKDRTNPAFKTKYADLSSVWEAWQAVGPANGLGVSQFPGAMIDGKVTLTSILTHSSGQWMRETLSIPVTKPDAQGYGSALTYARRYALSAIVGIAPEDDDGNAAVNKMAHVDRAPPPPKEWADSVKTMMAGIAAAATGIELRTWLRNNKPAVDVLDPDESEYVVNAYNARKANLASAETPQQKAA